MKVQPNELPGSLCPVKMQPRMESPMNFDKNREKRARGDFVSVLQKAWTPRQFMWMTLILMVGAFLVLAPSVASATGVPSAQPFTVKNGDYFINFLLKGLLGDVVNPNGASAQNTITAPGTLGEIFRTFNLGVTFFGSLIVMFLAVIGILNTGHDGEFLGKRWSSMWVPIRFAGGAALLLPVTASGYSFVQAMCLWIATQGVGFADNVWTTILDKVARRSGSDVVSPVSISAISSNIMASKLCQAFYNDRLAGSGTTMKFARQYVTSPGIQTYYQGWGKWDKLSMASSLAGTDAAFIPSNAGCGYMSFSYKPDASDPGDSVRSSVMNAHLEAVKDLGNQFEPVANAYMQTLFSSASGAVSTGDLEARETAVKNAIAQGATAYAQTIQQVAQTAIDSGPLANANKMAGTFDNMGFAVAGAFYMELAKVQNALRSGMQSTPSYTAADMKAIQAEFSSTNYQPVMDAIAEIIGGAALEYAASTSGDATVNVAGANNTRVQTIDLNEDMFKSFNGRDGFAMVVQNMSFTLVKLIIGVGGNNNSPISHFSWSGLGGAGAASGASTNASNGSGFSNNGAVNDNHSVIMQMKGKGDAILDMAGIVWAGYIGAKMFVAAANGNVVARTGNLMLGGGGALEAIMAGLEAVSAFIFTSVMSLIGIGIVLSIIIPLTPFMLWVMGIAGLMVLIIESLVASVIWAVMLMHPSGEGITSDQSRQGLMILLNLFMRPALMLMGMVCGIFMVEPMVTFVNDMFFFVFKSTQASSYTMLFITFGFISVYCTIVLAIIKKSFSLIHVVPDSVLAWIGHNPHNLGMADAADKAEALAGNSGTRVSQGVEAAGATMGQDSNRARRKMAQKIRDAGKGPAPAPAKT